MRLDRSWIERNIPHHGRMCLLDEVIEWDARHIRCRSGTHRSPDHPLRSRNRLSVACGISEVGFLAGLRDVVLHVARLDDIEADLYSEAELIAGDHGSALYEFVLTSEARRLLSGRATVVFDANRRFTL
jgi:predicted hotdog family 3-hydroxylacyl-ACP dehydratase